MIFEDNVKLFRWGDDFVSAHVNYGGRTVKFASEKASNEIPREIIY